MAQSRTSRKNGFFGFLTGKKVTYHRDLKKERAEAEGEKKAARARIAQSRKERLEDLRWERDRKALEREIVRIDKKIEVAEKKIDAAEKKESKGGMSEATFEAMKSRMEKEIAAQERHKAAIVSKNPRLKVKNAAAGRKARSGKKQSSPKKRGKGNPAEDAAAMYKKFHGRAPSKVTRIEVPLHEHKHLAEVGDLVRLVIDTPTGLVSVLDFNLTDPKKIVHLAMSEKDPATGKLVGKQLYLRGGDQEVPLKGLKMDSPLWIRDRMELGRLHEFKRGDRLIQDARGVLRTAQPGEKPKADEQEIKGAITYRTRKGMDNFQLIDYWHRAGEETSRSKGPGARPLVLYDYRNKKIEFAGGNYVIDAPGIIN